ncbi:hypothetical protein Mro03_62420 [Microbispora rosea subsp. rosea]|nr:hypothetical protein Mro03_62420 [Microbispora rosea subsp. rosea]
MGVPGVEQFEGVLVSCGDQAQQREVRVVHRVWVLCRAAGFGAIRCDTPHNVRLLRVRVPTWGGS